MHLTQYLIAILASAFLILAIVPVFIRKVHYVKRGILIDAPLKDVFDFLKLLKNQDQFNVWAKADPDRIWAYHGEDGNEGFTISWKGNRKAGEGEKEIVKIIDGQRIETQIRFIKPMRTTADVIMETISVSERQTQVNFINTGRINYPLNIFIPLAEKNFPKDMDASLTILKSILEPAKA